MNSRALVSLSLSALLLGGSMVGCTDRSSHVASAGDHDAARAAKQARRQNDKAVRALADNDSATAVRFAEAAVALTPRDAGYRMVLAQSYLRAGRFASARAAFADVLELTPGNGKAALNLALAQIAGGDWVAARATLAAHSDTIAGVDLGLATTLAGDPAGGIAILTPLARSGQGNAKIRQNLALSYALAGQWQMARVVAAADMSPADVDARIEQWAAFAQPKAASQQVASLLGVTPVADAGQPVALALNAPVPVAPLPAAPVVETAAVAAPVPVPAAVAAPVAKTVLVDVPVPPATPFRPVFAAAKEVVQPLPQNSGAAQGVARYAATPSSLIRSPRGPIKVALTPHAVVPMPAGSGDWYVQLGAFSNVGIAKAGWTRATERFAALSGHQPTGARVAAKAGNLYRLSVGGFDRDSAERMCRDYRAKGGACFVRREAGDQMAQWLRAPVQVASR
ncbi:SPOR domain-containing protein [Sphingomonas sp. MA1305]|uniref:SPOR domain-containing protein n=1 Tax=Sphingomonas sp. MA1305 TaxID=2479204 RepID=UPI0018E03438|nr:SPOR domain-containing protein [Sphingomonas sp. MA1305]MBI0474440.1 SPOR domain-containing protein [Sphingomonas sp. MA1305]